MDEGTKKGILRENDKAMLGEARGRQEIANSTRMCIEGGRGSGALNYDCCGRSRRTEYGGRRVAGGEGQIFLERVCGLDCWFGSGLRMSGRRRFGSIIMT